MVKIALDAGHGINTPGKRTPDGEREWSFNSAVLLACAERLLTYQGVDILRLDDPTGKTDVPLRTRTDKANAWGAAVLVSIHHNAAKGVWGTHGGVETYVQPGASKARDIANIVNPRIVSAMGLRNRGVQTKDLHMTRESVMPAILTEGGFMDSTVDIAAMRDPARLKAQGYAIADGLAEYFGLKPKSAQVTTAATEKPAEAKGAVYLDLNSRQRDELATVYEFARSKGVFSSAQHAADVKAGKMTRDTAIYLNTLIAAAALNGGERVKAN